MMLKAGITIKLLDVGQMWVIKELISSRGVKACYIWAKLH